MLQVAVLDRYSEEVPRLHNVPAALPEHLRSGLHAGYRPRPAWWLAGPGSAPDMPSTPEAVSPQRPVADAEVPADNDSAKPLRHSRKSSVRRMRRQHNKVCAHCVSLAYVLAIAVDISYCLECTFVPNVGLLGST